MKAQEAQAHLNQLWQKAQKQLEELFYYSEEEDLKKRLDPKSWSVTEVLFHINLLNESYLKNMPNIESLADADGNRSLKRSFVGRKLEKSMALKPDGSIAKKYKTPSLSDPIAAQKRGHAAVEQVIFREIVEDLKTIKQYIDILDGKALEKSKVPTLFPILKVNAADSLFILLKHELRHIAQAKRIMQG
ncbi:DinB family protein [Croceimicrobium hydrocarbonivorans]|uniref:DinB family protein n=1 Tax=Croceimicrobium hydrocarbonivorans TaxID=2761580 RepID=A0A7H0VFC7_9FLAO|nr:DinB family protein [Croceimicrobium hydrocarbonivorans]QNR24425.1 DinB family protein [Croceimicrobium hydrocarbonivorans]